VALAGDARSRRVQEIGPSELLNACPLAGTTSPRYTGALVTHLETRGEEQYSVLQLLPSAGPISTDRPPNLYEPVLLGFAPRAFRPRGFERVDG
jgi:hypothetical protein